MKATMYLATVIAVPTGATTLWHAIMPSSFCWLKDQEIGGCVVLFLLFIIIATGIKIALETIQE